MDENNFYSEDDIAKFIYKELEVMDLQCLCDLFYYELDNNFNVIWNTEYTRIVGSDDDSNIYSADEFDVIMREKNDSLYAYRIHCKSYEDLLEIVAGWLIASIKKCHPDFTPDDIYYNLLADISTI